jgi:hypothetical protein
MLRSVQTPIAFVIFNRPDLTAPVFAEIARAQPSKLLLIADGPRSTHPGEADRCAACRKIVERVDWPCEVLRNYSDENLGCRRRVSTGLDWVFQNAEAAIVLEDDCLPHPSLFQFFDEKLSRYRNDERVMMITGTNALGRWKAERQQYHFSYCGSIWGWASWRRAWRHYDVDMSRWADEETRQRVRDVFADPELYEGRLASYDAVYRGKVDTWDMQWSFARIIQSGLSVVPAVNLVSNIGFGPDATHTRKSASPVAALPTEAMSFPIRFHDAVAVDRAYDLEFTRRLTQPAKAP